MKILNMILIAVFLFAGLSFAQSRQAAAVAPGTGFDSKLETDFFRAARYFVDNKTRLGLSEQQVKKILDLSKTVKAKLAKLNDDIQDLTGEINTLMWEAPMNLAETNNLVAEKYKLKQQKSEYLLKQTKELKGILTPEQLEKYKNL